MCMTSVDKVHAQTENQVDEQGDDAVIRYAIQKKSSGHYGTVFYRPAFTIINTLGYQSGDWHESEAFKPWNTKKIHQGDIQYPRGFHVFKSEEDARKFAKDWGAMAGEPDIFNYTYLVQVMVKGLIAKGKQNIEAIIESCDVEVYHMRMIIREIPW